MVSLFCAKANHGHFTYIMSNKKAGDHNVDIKVPHFDTMEKTRSSIASECMNVQGVSQNDGSCPVSCVTNECGGFIGASLGTLLFLTVIQFSSHFSNGTQLPNQCGGVCSRLDK
jgi:hypothetical protein